MRRERRLLDKQIYKSYDDLPLMLSVPEAYELARSRDFSVKKIGSCITVLKEKFLLWIKTQCGQSRR